MSSYPLSWRLENLDFDVFVVIVYKMLIKKRTKNQEQQTADLQSGPSTHNQHTPNQEENQGSFTIPGFDSDDTRNGLVIGIREQGESITRNENQNLNTSLVNALKSYSELIAAYQAILGSLLNATNPAPTVHTGEKKNLTELDMEIKETPNI